MKSRQQPFNGMMLTKANKLLEAKIDMLRANLEAARSQRDVSGPAGASKDADASQRHELEAEISLLRQQLQVRSLMRVLPSTCAYTASTYNSMSANEVKVVVCVV